MMSPENQIKEINIKRVIWEFLHYLSISYPYLLEQIKSKIPNLLYLKDFNRHYSYMQHLINNNEIIMDTFKLCVTDDSQKNEIYNKFFIYYANKLKQPKLGRKEKFARSAAANWPKILPEDRDGIILKK